MNARITRVGILEFIYSIFFLTPNFEIRQTRDGIVKALLFFCALSLYWRTDPHLAAMEATLFGGLLGTLVYEPMQNVRINPGFAQWLGASIVIVGLIAMPFAISKASSSVEILHRFIAGAFMFACICIASRMRPKAT